MPPSIIDANRRPAAATLESTTLPWRVGDQIWARRGYTLSVVGTVAGMNPTTTALVWFFAAISCGGG
jgi:hypothetical protein